MALSQPKKVNYSANQRLDLLDKTAEYTTGDDNDNQWRRACLANDPDGRVLSGWRTTTANGANAGFVIAAEAAAAVDRAGNLLILDGSASLTVPLTQNTINYIHAYYAETTTDADTRRFFTAGAETVSTTYTRVTRTPNLYRVTTAFGGGTPVFAGFQATALIGGATVQLIPLYGVAVDNTNTVTSVLDFRPMFAPAAGTAGNNQYEATSGRADLPFNFAPATNAATLNITTVRQALAAIADRIKDIKGSTNWYANSQNQWQYTAANGGTLTSPTSNVNMLGASNAVFTQQNYATDSTIQTGLNLTSSVSGGPSYATTITLTDTVHNYPLLNYSNPGSLTLGAAGSTLRVNTNYTNIANSLGIGANPSNNTLCVYGSVGVGVTAYNVAAPANGLLVQGNVISQGNITAASSYALTSSGAQVSTTAGSHGFSVSGAITFSQSNSVIFGPSSTVCIPLTVPVGAVVTGYEVWGNFQTTGGNLGSQVLTVPSNGTYSAVTSSANTAVVAGYFSVALACSFTAAVRNTYLINLTSDAGVASQAISIRCVTAIYTIPNVPVSLIV